MAVNGTVLISRLNVEIKACINNHSRIREYLKAHNADFRGIDYQRDTYFRVHHGRLKIREGNIENCIVFYDRDNIPGPKKCRYILEHFEPDDPSLARLKELLSASLGVLCVVEKEREIYYIGHSKFHLDTIKELGTFFEIEVIETDGISEEVLRRECEDYLEKFGIPHEKLIHISYSDMLIQTHHDTR